MKKRGNSVLWIIALIAGAAILLIFYRERFPFGKNNTAFAVEGKVKITKVLFYEGERKLMLSKKGKEWLVDNKELAREEAVLALTSILRDIKVKSPVTSETFRHEIIEKKVQPVKVFVYEGRRPRKSFIVYHTDSNIHGNIMKLKPSSKPYIMYVPGFENDIGLYFTAGRHFWIPFTVFTLMPSEISAVKLENIRDTASSFSISSGNGRYLLRTPGRGIIEAADSIKIRRYVSYFNYIPFERWASELNEDEKRTIIASEPLYVITVVRSDGTPIRLTVWEKMLTADDGKKVADIDRVWAVTDENQDIFVMRYFDLDPVLKKRTYFFKD